MSEPAVLPNRLEAERALLGGLLLAPGYLTGVAEGLTPADFYERRHGFLFQELLTMQDAGIPIELTSIVQRILDDKPNGFDLVAWVTELSDRAPAGASLPHYAGLIAENARRRRIYQDVLRASEALVSGAELDDVIARLQDIGQPERRGVGPESMADLMEQVIEDHERRVRRYRDGQSVGLPLGLHALEQRLTLEAGQLCVLAGRPGMGKTALAMLIACSASKKGAVLVFSLEMGARELGSRVAFGDAQVPLRKGLQGWTTNQEISRVIDAADGASSLQVWVDDEPGLTIEQIRRRARSFHARHPLVLVVIDHIGLCGPTRGIEGRTRQVGHVSQCSKRLAKELGVSVLALCQLNRSVDATATKRPGLCHLRDSGEIEQDADTVAFVFRASAYQEQRGPAEEVEEAEVIVSKNRQGPTGTAAVGWSGRLVRFVELEQKRWER